MQGRQETTNEPEWTRIFEFSPRLRQRTGAFSNPWKISGPIFQSLEITAHQEVGVLFGPGRKNNLTPFLA
jgi:hypothetical protein